MRLETVRWALSRSTSREPTPSWLNVKENKSRSAKLGEWFIGSSSAIHPGLNCCCSDLRQSKLLTKLYIYSELMLGQWSQICLWNDIRNSSGLLSLFSCRGTVDLIALPNRVSSTAD